MHLPFSGNGLAYMHSQSFLSAVIVPKADLKTASQHFTGS